MDSLSPLVQALLIVNPLLSVLVGASLWFGLGGRLGKLEATMDGNKETGEEYRKLVAEQILQLKREREACQERERTALEDHEQRVRQLERHTHDGEIARL